MTDNRDKNKVLEIFFKYEINTEYLWHYFFNASYNYVYIFLSYNYVDIFLSYNYVDIFLFDLS